MPPALFSGTRDARCSRHPRLWWPPFDHVFSPLKPTGPYTPTQRTASEAATCLPQRCDAASPSPHRERGPFTTLYRLRARQRRFRRVPRAGWIGQAEAAALTWRDVEWQNQRLCIRRQKTGALFYVPIYAHLLPLLQRLQRNGGTVSPDTRVFRIKDAKKALRTGCVTLRLPRFSQRNMRQCLIMRLWKSGVDEKLIAK